jgi:hypothetical protein
MLVVTDANLGWSARTFLISQIDKDFQGVSGTKQNWTVSFFDPGGATVAGPASGHRLLRTLTRQAPF